MVLHVSMSNSLYIQSLVKRDPFVEGMLPAFSQVVSSKLAPKDSTLDLSVLQVSVTLAATVKQLHDILIIVTASQTFVLITSYTYAIVDTFGCRQPRVSAQGLITGHQ